MKSRLINLGKYALTFLITLSILLGVLILTAKIPKEWIKENMIESKDSFEDTAREVKYIGKYRDYLYIHPYADALLLNIIYNIDTDNPVKSVMEAKYYQEDLKYSLGIRDFFATVDNNEGPNKEYLRYWHGSISIIRPLLTIFNIEQIYTINKVLLPVLIILLAGILLRKGYKLLTFALIIGLILVATWTVPYCLEFTWCFLIMFIVAIIAVIIEKKHDNILNYLFLITGMITCFLDFLTTELITGVVPMILVLGMRFKDNRLGDIKENLKLLSKWLILWGVGYFGMWISKWIIASIVLNINALDYVTDKAMIRIKDYTGSIKALLIENINSLYIINTMKVKYKVWIPAIIILIALLVVDRKNKKKMSFLAIMLLIALLPYIRYLILQNHSYRHYFMVFRTQIISIMALIIGIGYASKEIKLRKKEKK